MSIILGINAFHAGASAALVINGELKFAIAEERLNRIKYYAGFPNLSIKNCLDFAGLDIKDVDHIAIGRNPLANLNKKLLYVSKNLNLIFNFLKIKRFKNNLDNLKLLLQKECNFNINDMRFKIHNVEHHIAHTASTYFTSQLNSASGITIDGSGDFVTCMMSKCDGNNITPIHKIFVPNSLGTFYSSICQFIGFGNYGDEGKVMGLAPYGEDTYSKFFDDLITFENGNIILSKKYFSKFGSDQGIFIKKDGTMGIHNLYSNKMIKQIGKPRKIFQKLTQRDKDLAYGVQKKFEEIYFKLINHLYKLSPSKDLVLAGGCALNSVANGKIYDNSNFQNTFIHPASADDGLSVGAALFTSSLIKPRNSQVYFNSAYLGNDYKNDFVKKSFSKYNLKYQKLSNTILINKIVENLKKGKVIGWFQGRSEWGPRALGNRSILCHPGYPGMKKILNDRIKKREPFRPFAPIVLEKHTKNIFEKTQPSKYMLHVYKIKKSWRKKLSAVNHVDNTGRLQTLTKLQNPILFELIKAFEKKTKIPVVLNTSFNENEPIVETPSQAIECFLRTKIDVIVINNFYCSKVNI